LCSHWISEGQPLGTERLGSFEHWAEIVGGILGANDIDGFLGNLDTFYEAVDLEGAVWRQFVAAWADKHGESEVGVAELFVIALDLEGLEIGKGTERAQKTTFGKALNRQRDRVIGEFRIVNTRTVQRAKRWRLIRARTEDNPFAGFYGPQEAPEPDDQAGWI